VINLVGRSASNQYNEASIFANHGGNLVMTPASDADFFVMKGSNSTKLFQVTDAGNVGTARRRPPRTST
jgi:hypothetical protein